MKKMLFLTMITLVLGYSTSIFGMAPGWDPSMPFDPRPSLKGLFVMKPAQQNFEILKELYDAALNLQERIVSLKIQQYDKGGAASTLRDVTPLLMDLETAIANLGPTIITLKETLLNLKPQDMSDFKEIVKKATELKDADEALKLTTPALSIKTPGGTPGQKALEEKRVKALKAAREEKCITLFCRNFLDTSN